MLLTQHLMRFIGKCFACSSAALYYSKTSGLLESVVVYVCVAKERSAMHMTTLEDLYYGNIHPFDWEVVRASPPPIRMMSTA